MQIFLITILAIILSIEKMNGQFGLARALIACTLTGLILGDAHTGLMIGVQLQMIFIGMMGVGAAVPPDETIASIIATYLAISSGEGPEFALTLAMPIALASQAIDILARTLTVVVQHYAENQIEKNNFKAINAHLLGLIFIAVRVSIVVAPALIYGVNVVQNILESIPEWFLRGLEVSGGILPVVGFAMLLNMFNISHLKPFLFIGFAMATWGGFNTVGVTLIAVCVALLLDYYNSNKQTEKSGIDELDELISLEVSEND